MNTTTSRQVSDAAGIQMLKAGAGRWSSHAISLTIASAAERCLRADGRFTVELRKANSVPGNANKFMVCAQVAK